MYYRILRIGSMLSDSTYGPDGYRMETTIRSEGVVRTFFPWTLYAESRGEVAGGALRPTEHQTDSNYRGQLRRVEMEYRDGDVAQVRLAGPPRPEDGDEVPAVLRTTTVDPLTATLTVLRTIAAGRGCTSVQRVFDGRRRYDLRYEDLGPAELEPSSYRSYSGPARLCRSTLEPIAGFTPPGRTTAGALVTRSWIAAPAPGVAPVPVQMELTGRAGTLLVYLRDDDLAP